MAYGYRYDKLNRITNAHYVKGEKRPDDTFEHAGRYNLEILPQGSNPSGYDLNGNILNLKRYGISGGNPASPAGEPAAIDVLSYHYDGNQLTQVDDAGTQDGFKDGTNEGDDYEYDANGNMTTDRNKGIENITYNHLNLPMVIVMSENRKIEYIYDAAGIKLSQRVYEDDTQPATKTTNYIGERVYETKGGEDIKLQFLHHEEGRIVKGPEPGDPDWTPDAKDWVCQYHLKDHLGNTRLTFGEADTTEYLLTMEIDPIENRIIEAEDFENVFESEDNRVPDLNHTPVSASTPNPEYVIFLNGTERMMGPAKSLKVLPGDQVAIDAYAKYLHLESYNSSVAGNMLLSGFLGTFLNAGSEFLINNGYVDEGLLAGLENLANGGEDYTGVPQAYLNYILFDKEYNVIEGKKLQIGEAGKFEIGDTNLGLHEHLQIDPITIAKEGYIYIYLSNQTPGSEVYFDDLMITHTQGRVVQKDDYYPFGLTFNTSQREGSLNNKYLYQGKEREELTGWDDFEWRQYDPILGRTPILDPHAYKYSNFSPYSWAANNPVSVIDPDGRDIIFGANSITFTESDAQAVFSVLKNNYASNNSKPCKGSDCDEKKKDDKQKALILTKEQAATVAFIEGTKQAARYFGLSTGAAFGAVFMTVVGVFIPSDAGHGSTRINSLSPEDEERYNDLHNERMAEGLDQAQELEYQELVELKYPYGDPLEPMFEKMRQGNNQKKNQEVTSLYKEFGITDKDTQRKIHDMITGKNLTRDEIKEVIKSYLDGR